MVVGSNELEQCFKIDLTKIEGDGEFPCPNCGIIISPDDYSELIYNILDVRIKEDRRVENILFQCRICRSITCLYGFDLLQDYSLYDGSTLKFQVESLSTTTERE